MNLAKYIIAFSIATGLCWLSWLFVLLSMTPKSGTPAVFILFYASLWLSLFGSFSIGGLLLRFKFADPELAHRHMKISIREAFLFAALIISSLILQSHRYLTWWNLLILVILALFIELFFMSYKKFRN